MIIKVYYLVINLLAMFLYALDKHKAIAHQYRIPEKRLLLMGFLGGGPGSLVGMYGFHHKTAKRKFQILVPLWTAVHLALIGFCLYQNNHLMVTQYDLNTGLNVRIVQISDLHNAELWWNKDHIPNRVAELEPDIIVITGDIADSNHTDIDSAVYTAGRLAEIADTYYITGNHEYWLSEEEREELFAGLKEKGVICLFNEYELLQKGDQTFALIGLDDRSLGDDTLKEILGKIDGDTVKIVLAHEPQFIENYAGSNADFVLVGHAHGGQFILPGIGPVVAPDQGFRPKYTSGVVRRERTTMVISRGLGNSIIPIRLFNCPEIVVADF